MGRVPRSYIFIEDIYEYLVSCPSDCGLCLEVCSSPRIGDFTTLFQIRQLGIG